MQKTTLAILVLILATAVARPASAQQQPSVARPEQLLSKVITGMPTSTEQEVRVFTATFSPGDRTAFHTHRRPMTVYWPLPNKMLQPAARGVAPKR